MVRRRVGIPRISHALGPNGVQAGSNRSRDRPNRHGGALNAVEETRKSLITGTAWVSGIDSGSTAGRRNDAPSLGGPPPVPSSITTRTGPSGQSPVFDKWVFRPSCAPRGADARDSRRIPGSPCEAMVLEGDGLVERVDFVVQTRDQCRNSRAEPIALPPGGVIWRNCGGCTPVPIRSKWQAAGR